MPQYNYFECRGACVAGANDIPKTGKYRFAVEIGAHGAWAQPTCLKCGGLVTHLGSGTAPYAPPGTPYVAPATGPLSSAETVLATGNGTDTTGRAVAYRITENAAEHRIRISLNVNGGNTLIASLVRDQLQRVGGAPERWLVRPPFSQGAPDVWVKLDVPAMLNIHQPIYMNAQQPRMPAQFDIRMNLGSHRFGLVHLLAGHYANTRTWIGTDNPSRVDAPPAVPNADAQRRHDEALADQESYRTIQGVQRALTEALSPRAIQRVVKSGNDKYVLVGTFRQRPARIVVQSNAGTYTVTTMYINDQTPSATLAGGDVLLWQRPPNRR